MRRVLAIAWLLAYALVTGCTTLFFQPLDKLIRTPKDIGLDYEDIWLESADGVLLNAWFLPAKTFARGTVLFLHGNAENISTHIGAVFWLPERGFNVLLLDYRGYGQSRGTPTLPGVLQDIDAAMKHLLDRKDVSRDRIIIFGQSLGGALALNYVADSPLRPYVKALIVDSAFSSFRGIALEKLRLSWLTRLVAVPLGWTITDAHRPLAAVEKISPIPLLLIHGEDDNIVPYPHSERLFAAAGEPKSFWLIPGTPHTAALTRPDIRARLVVYIGQQLDR